MARRLALLVVFTAFAASAIEGGQADKGDPAVGMIWIQKHGGGPPGLCTGTLIAPDVVLTAGHCVSGMQVMGFYTGLGAQGTVSHFVQPTDGQHAIAETAIFPGFKPGLCPNASGDYALLKLAAKVPRARPLALDLRMAAKGRVCRAVGFGGHANADGSMAFEQKRRALEAVSASSPLYVQVTWKTGIPGGGDSGGPLLCGAGVAGVVSCHTDDGPQHRTEFYATAAGAKSWIAETLAKWSAAAPR